jgi:hypothetical protein
MTAPAGDRLRAMAATWDTWATEARTLAARFTDDHLQAAAAHLRGQAAAHQALAAAVRDEADRMETPDAPA